MIGIIIHTAVLWITQLNVWYLLWYHTRVDKKVLGELQHELANPKNTRFAVALRVATTLFGSPTVKGSHHVFKMPWAGNPRVNLQPQGKKAKDYQVEQLLEAIERLEKENG